MKRVAILQSAPRFGEVEWNLADVRSAISGLKADLLVLPELFATGYQFTSRAEVEALAEPAPGGPTTAALEALASDTGATVVAGLAERAADGRIFNAAALVYPSGFLTTYRKLHLFADERAWFAPGDELPPLIRTPQGLRVGVMICFDWRFPEVARFLALEGADVLAHPANLVRPYAPDAMITRALENKVFAATANRVGSEARGGMPELTYIGRSQVVSPRGERVASLGPSEVGVAIADVDPTLARRKGVTGCDDLLAARRSDLLNLEPRRRRDPRRFVLLEHATGDGSVHFDLLIERDRRLLAWRFPEPPRSGLAAQRVFDHRLRYLDFEGDLGGARGSVHAIERGMLEPLEETTSELHARFPDGTELRIVLENAETDLWRVEDCARTPERRTR